VKQVIQKGAMNREMPLGEISAMIACGTTN
jgi:hypothetical protein